MGREAWWFSPQVYIYLNCVIDGLQSVSFRCLKVKVLLSLVQLFATLWTDPICTPPDTEQSDSVTHTYRVGL